MRRSLAPGVVVFASLLVGCSGAQGDDQPTTETQISASQGAGSVPPSLRGQIVNVEVQTGEAGRYAEPCLITEDSISGVRAPSTLGAFAGAFPEGTALVFEPSHMVDFGSFCLEQQGAERVCTLFYEADVTGGWDPNLEALGLYTTDPACRTAEGVGPGSSVADAVAAFGAVEFQFNYDNEGREYAAFANAPQTLGFRVASDAGTEIATSPGGDVYWPNGAFGGDYRASDEAFLTRQALPDAVIAEVSVY